MRTRTKAIALGILFLTVAAILGYQYLLSPIGSGVWQYDYRIAGMTVNGDAFGYDAPDATSAGAYDYEHVFDNEFEWWLGIIFQDDYNIQVDPDGNPAKEFTGWTGLAPDVYAILSGAYRVDFTGERIPFNYEDPGQVSHQTDQGTLFEYYYDFTIRCGTDADQFPFPGTQYHSHECGGVDADIQLTVVMRKSLFTSEVKGEFADAYVIDYEHNDLQLQSGLDWAITPSVSPGARNAQLQITDRQALEDQYVCTIHVPFGMQSGLVKSGLNLEKYDVWITKKVRFTLLLTEPLDIGSQADDLSGGDAPPFVPAFDWRLALIILGIGAFVLIAFFIYIRFRNRD